MKTMARFLMFLVCAGSLVACTEDSIPPHGTPADDMGVFTTIFNADFSVWDHSDYAGGCCANAPICYLTLVGHGNGTPIGFLNAKFSISCNKSSGTYSDGFGMFVAENGDELYFFVKEGHMLPNTGENCDVYDTCFNDLAEFNGGTGMFKGATGFFHTNAFIHNGMHDEWRTDFFSYGTLKTLHRLQKHQERPPNEEISNPTTPAGTAPW
jgi:hypothetical protein